MSVCVCVREKELRAVLVQIYFCVQTLLFFFFFNMCNTSETLQLEMCDGPLKGHSVRVHLVLLRAGFTVPQMSTLRPPAG